MKSSQKKLLCVVSASVVYQGRNTQFSTSSFLSGDLLGGMYGKSIRSSWTANPAISTTSANVAVMGGVGHSQRDAGLEGMRGARMLMG